MWKPVPSVSPVPPGLLTQCSHYWFCLPVCSSPPWKQLGTSSIWESWRVSKLHSHSHVSQEKKKKKTFLPHLPKAIPVPATMVWLMLTVTKPTKGFFWGFWKVVWDVMALHIGVSVPMLLSNPCPVHALFLPTCFYESGWMATVPEAGSYN